MVPGPRAGEFSYFAALAGSFAQTEYKQEGPSTNREAVSLCNL